MYIIFIYLLNVYQIYLIYNYISISDIYLNVHQYVSKYITIPLSIYTTLFYFYGFVLILTGRKRNWRLKVGKWKSSSGAHSGGQWGPTPSAGLSDSAGSSPCSLFSTCQPWESPEMCGLRLKWGCKPEPVDIAAIPLLLRFSISNPTLPP